MLSVAPLHATLICVSETVVAVTVGGGCGGIVSAVVAVAGSLGSDSFAAASTAVTVYVYWVDPTTAVSLYVVVDPPTVSSAVDEPFR